MREMGEIRGKRQARGWQVVYTNIGYCFQLAFLFLLSFFLSLLFSYKERDIYIIEIFSFVTFSFKREREREKKKHLNMFICRKALTLRMTFPDQVVKCGVFRQEAKR